MGRRDSATYPGDKSTPLPRREGQEICHFDWNEERVK